MNDIYVSRKIALHTLGISPMTLLKLEKTNMIDTIKTPGGHRKYNVGKYIAANKKTVDNVKDKVNDKIGDNVDSSIDVDIEQKVKKDEKLNICYVRVSTAGQKDDLQHQKAYMKNKYPSYIIIEDIGSGINFNRKGLRKIIKLAIEGKINNLVVAYKDRLTRFGYELIEDLVIEYSNGKIIIENEKDVKKEPKEELVEDVLQILNVYTAKMNGLRKYKCK